MFAIYVFSNSFCELCLQFTFTPVLFLSIWQKDSESIPFYNFSPLALVASGQHWLLIGPSLEEVQYTYTLGGVIFWKKILGTCHVVVDCSGTSNPEFYSDLLLFHLAHGKTRPQKTPKILMYKGLKSAKKNFFWHFLRFHLKQMLFLILFKSKNEEKLETNF